MNKHDLIQKIKALDGISQDERAYLIDLVNTKKKYGLVWEDKPEAVEEQLRENLPVLREVVERRILGAELPQTTKTEGTQLSLETETPEPENQEYPNHILIEGDNLHALTALTFTHENKIDLIYIDPPYNTESKDFKYNDTLVDKNDSFRHSKWLSFMEKRLLIAKKLLTPNGLIVSSIDDNEVAQLKLLFDSIFTQSSKIIAVKMSEASGLKMGAVKKAGNIPKYKEYLIFARIGGIRDLKFDYIPKEQWDEEYNIFLENFSQEDKNIIEEISEKDEPNEEDIFIIDKILSKVSLSSVASKLRDFKLSNSKEIINWKFENSYRICRSAASSSVKRLADEKREICKNLLFAVISRRDKLIYIVKGDYGTSSTSPRVQMIFAQDNLSMHPGDFWSDIKTTGLEAEGNIEFKNGKKPISLLKRIIKSIDKKDAIILDFFAGSGSTMHTAMHLNNSDNGTRKCILVTNNENNICEEVTYIRLKNVINGYKNSRGEISEGLIKNNLRYYKTDFVKSQKSLENKRQLTALSTQLLCIKEDCYTELTSQFALNENQAKIFTNNQGKYLVVAYYSRQQLQVYEQLIGIIQGLSDATEKIKLYAFSPEKETLVEDFIEVADKIDAVPLPDAIYNAYRATFRAIKLDKKAPVSFQSTETESPEPETEEIQN